MPVQEKKLLGDLYISNRFFIASAIVCVFFILSYFHTSLLFLAKAFLFILMGLLLLDYVLLFFMPGTLEGSRATMDAMSNGDENDIELHVANSFSFPLHINIIDEIPFQFQERDFEIKKTIQANDSIIWNYKLKPTERGEYLFGDIQIFAKSLIGFAERRFTSLESTTIKVYPSYLKIKKYQFQSITDPMAKTGNRKNYRRGMSAEFDHIKEYNRGDDVRTINWKASARRNSLMVNSFMDEKSQQIYCVIDKGRLMKMPFDGLSLLDYAINASLMFSYVALQKDDKIGLVTFSESVNDVVKSAKNTKQFNKILETLYKQETRFLESNFAELYARMNRGLGQRSLLFLFTNFETYSGFERQFTYLKAINKRHLLCVILFENTEVSRIHDGRGDNLEDIYIKTIADKFSHEKQLIIKELQKAGILTIYTKPAHLSVQVVNKYLQLKAKQII